MNAFFFLPSLLSEKSHAPGIQILLELGCDLLPEVCLSLSRWDTHVHSLPGLLPRFLLTSPSTVDGFMKPWKGKEGAPYSVSTCFPYTELIMQRKYQIPLFSPEVTSSLSSNCRGYTGNRTTLSYCMHLLRTVLAAVSRFL